MIINLSPTWRIRSEPNNWIVEELPAVKTRKVPQWKSRAFLRDFPAALSWAVYRRIELIEGEYGSEALEPLCTALDRLQGQLRDIRAELANG